MKNFKSSLMTTVLVLGKPQPISSSVKWAELHKTVMIQVSAGHPLSSPVLSTYPAIKKSVLCPSRALMSHSASEPNP